MFKKRIATYKYQYNRIKSIIDFYNNDNYNDTLITGKGFQFKHGILTTDAGNYYPTK